MDKQGIRGGGGGVERGQAREGVMKGREREMKGLWDQVMELVRIGEER